MRPIVRDDVLRNVDTWAASRIAIARCIRRQDITPNEAMQARMEADRRLKERLAIAYEWGFRCDG